MKAIKTFLQRIPLVAKLLMGLILISFATALFGESESPVEVGLLNFIYIVGGCVIVLIIVALLFSLARKAKGIKLPKKEAKAPEAAVGTVTPPAPAKAKPEKKPKTKLPLWITIPLGIFLIFLAVLAGRWAWEFSPDQLKQVPSVSGGSSSAATRPALASLRCLGQSSVIAVIAPGQSVFVSLDAGRTMETYPSSPNLVIEVAGDPSQSTRDGGHLDAASNFYRVRNLLPTDGSSFYFSCEYR